MAQTMFRNALLAAVPIILAAQEPAPIRVNVREVVVPVTGSVAEARASARPTLAAIRGDLQRLTGLV